MKREAAENRIAYLRPDQIRRRLSAVPVVYVPIGPLEWHGPHMPYGTDPLNAERVAAGVCARTGGLLWPTTYWGTERERPPQVAEFLGFKPRQYVVGMDFPGISVPSSYCPEEVFAIVMRELLSEVARLGAKLAVIINGHGSVNHDYVLQRLKREFDSAGDLAVHIRMAFLRTMLADGSIGHADAIETSMMMAMTDSVDLSKLPSVRKPLEYKDFAIVDGPGFDGKGPADRTVPAHCDPRKQSSRAAGNRLNKKVIDEISDEMAPILKTLKA